MPHPNLIARLRLLRIALTRRFIYPDLVALAREYGMAYEDVPGDLEPFGFVENILGPRAALPAAPDFASLIEPAERFTPANAPGGFNSEACVGRFLGQLVFRQEAKVVVELGCFVGWTTAHMALALRFLGGERRLYALDYMPEYLEVMQANLRRHEGLDRLVTPLRGMSLDPAVLAALPGAIDVLFIDTSHSYPDTRDEILAYAPRLAPNGVIGLHDSTSAPGVRRSIQELADRFHVLTFATERSNGLTVLRPRRPSSRV
jgi:predicted O-methyltransferase YrrM